MGKSSSSSSDSSDYEWKHLPKHQKKAMKKWKKKMRKGKIPYGTPPPFLIAGYAGPHFSGKHGKHGHHGHGHHGHMAPGYAPAGYPAGAVPHAGAYGQAVHPPPAGYAAPPAGYAAPPAGYAAPQAGYGAGGFAPPPGGYPAGAVPPPHGPVYPAGQYPQAPGQYPTKEDCVAYNPDEAHDSSDSEEEHVGEVGAEAPEVEEHKDSDADDEADQEEAKEEHKEHRGSPPPEEHEEEKKDEHSGGEEEKEEKKEKEEEEKEKEEEKKEEEDKDEEEKEEEEKKEESEVEKAADEVGAVTLDGNAEEFTPAVVDAEDFSGEKDAETLRQAMRGAGTNEAGLTEVIGHRSAKQRQDIAVTYKTMFGKDLMDDLESELSGDFQKTIMGLFKPPAYYDAWCLHEAMKGAGTKDHVLIEILCTRTNDQIAEIVSNYKEHFGRDLEQDVIDDTSGKFKRLMVSCCQGARSELTPEQLDQVRSDGWESVVNHEQAKEDAQRLYDAGENKWGTDESTFLQILAMRNYYQLRAVFEEYEKIAGCDILESIESEMSGNLESGLKALARAARNRPEYFADKLHSALNRIGTKDSTLIRIIVSRSEIDLKDIQEMFQQKYDKDLAAMIESDTSGDYKQLLLAVLGK